MVDLDNDPTKLIEIVEIGKQLLMTRGTLTYLLHRQRRREVFRHRPGAVHRLDSVARRAERHAPPLARKRHSLGGDLQRPDHSAAHPAGPARRDLQTDRGLGPRCAATFFIYGLGGLIAPFIGIKLIDMLISIFFFKALLQL